MVIKGDVSINQYAVLIQRVDAATASGKDHKARELRKKARVVYERARVEIESQRLNARADLRALDAFHATKWGKNQLPKERARLEATMQECQQALRSLEAMSIDPKKVSVPEGETKGGIAVLIALLLAILSGSAPERPLDNA